MVSRSQLLACLLVFNLIINIKPLMLSMLLRVCVCVYCDGGANKDEGGAIDVDDMAESSIFLGDEEKFRKRENEMALRRAKGDGKIAGRSARSSQLHADQEAWETTRMLQSGVAVRSEIDTDFNEEDDSRVQLMVHRLAPPFLDGRVSFSNQQKLVATVKDSSSDFATCARNGSALVRQQREKRERAKMRLVYVYIDIL